MSRAQLTMRAYLEHLAIVSWPVRAERLQAMLPDPLVPLTIDDGGEWALVSMAMMLDTTLNETYPQLNERAYVRRLDVDDGSSNGAYFWRSHAATWQAPLFRLLLGIPEIAARLKLETPERGSGEYVFRRNGRAVARLWLGGGAPPQAPKAPEPPAYKKLKVPHVMGQAKKISENPMIGYTMNWGRLHETTVAHDLIDAQLVPVTFADPSFMIPSVTIAGDARRTPLLAVYQRWTPFNIVLPPRPVAGARQY